MAVGVCRFSSRLHNGLKDARARAFPKDSVETALRSRFDAILHDRVASHVGPLRQTGMSAQQVSRTHSGVGLASDFEVIEVSTADAEGDRTGDNAQKHRSTA